MESDLDEDKASVRLMTVRRKLADDLSTSFQSAQQGNGRPYCLGHRGRVGLANARYVFGRRQMEIETTNEIDARLR